MPAKYGTYHEVFLGGGALFFALQPKNAILSDINTYLVNSFKAVRDDTAKLIQELGHHKRIHDKGHYNDARKRLHLETDPSRSAALFIYLNRTCFNGLYRVNSGGRFNVPMGAYQNPRIVDEQTLYECARSLRGVTIRQGHFADCKIRKGDFYYLDPPYHNSYAGYDRSGFSDDDHCQLAEFCRRIDANLGYFMLSNSDTPMIRKLYAGFNIEVVSSRRTISRDVSQRGKKQELIIRNYR